MQEALLGTDPNKLKKGGIYYLALHQSIPTVKYVGKIGDSELGVIYLFQRAYSGEILKLESEQVKRSVTKEVSTESLKKCLVLSALWGSVGAVVFSAVAVPMLEDELRFKWSQKHMAILVAGSVALCMGSGIASFYHEHNNSPEWKRSDSNKSSLEILAERNHGR